MGITLPTVRNFLFCLTLETGGLVLGWLTAIFSAIGAILLAASVILAIVGFDTLEGENKGATLAVLVVVFVIYIIYFCVVCYAGIQLVRGTKNRNSQQMKLFLIITAIGVVLSFLQIVTAGLAGLAGAIISAIIEVYFFICIYSLYQLVKVG